MPSKKTSEQQKKLDRALFFVLAGGLACILLAYFAQYRLFAGGKDAPAQPAARVLVNEVMSLNRGSLADDYGGYPDWIEVVNQEDQPVSLSGWRLATEKKPLKAFVFPDVTLKPGECALVYASGRGSGMHASFKLSASGEMVVLMDANGVRADAVEVPALSADMSWSRDVSDGTWSATHQITPGLPNEEAYVSERAVAQDPVRLNEIVADNASLTGSGNDLIELFNASDRTVSLFGYSLSDDPSKPGKYTLGDMNLSAGECLLLEADGSKIPFRLSAQGEQVLLYNPQGILVDSVQWEALGADRSLSFSEGGWTDRLPPTPGQPNTYEAAAQADAQLVRANGTGVLINEILASSSESGETDWVELYNSGSGEVDLSGMGLSDDPAHPRKWQFPAGTTLAGGAYLTVRLSGRDTVDSEGRLHANFSLSCSGGEVVTLSTADGQVVDRAAAVKLYGDVSYGRARGQDGFFYFVQPTPGADNGTPSGRYRAEKPEFSVEGGLFGAGETVALTLNAPEGTTVRYTLDCTEPDENSPVYTAPITLSANTIVRAKAFAPGALPSYTQTRSYLFGLSHTVRVVSLVSAPEGLFSDETGIMALGAGVEDADPYEGANFWKDWEREGHVEIFETDGSALLDQGCGVRLHGTNSRKRPQKAFCLTARMTYDEDNRFRASLFSAREYTEYQSFILRAGGQDNEMSRLRDTVIDRFAADTQNLYQEGEVCVVYLNGEYWGQYDMREKVNRFSIAQFEGWAPDDDISIVKSSVNVLRGSNRHYEALMDWIGEHPSASDEDIAYVETQADLNSYLDYIALMVYSGNQDIGMRRYRNADADGRWRWVIFDMDYGFYNDTDSMRRWMDPEGAGTYKTADNRLFVYIMKNAGIKDRFLTRFGQLVTGPWAAERAAAQIQAQYEKMLPEMQMHYARWTGSSMERWQKYVDEILEYAATREEKIIGYTKQHFSLTDAEMQKYFGAR